MRAPVVGWLLLSGCALRGFVPAGPHPGDVGTLHLELEEVLLEGRSELRLRLTTQGAAESTSFLLADRAASCGQRGTPAQELWMDGQPVAARESPLSGPHRIEVVFAQEPPLPDAATLEVRINGPSPECLRIPVWGEGAAGWRLAPRFGVAGGLEAQVPSQQVGGLGVSSGARVRAALWATDWLLIDAGGVLGLGSLAPTTRRPARLTVMEQFGAGAEARVFERGPASGSLELGGRFTLPVSSAEAVLEPHLIWRSDELPQGLGAAVPVSAWELGLPLSLRFSTQGSGPAVAFVVGLSLGFRLQLQR